MHEFEMQGSIRVSREPQHEESRHQVTGLSIFSRA